MHTPEGSTHAWHPPGPGAAGLLWEVPSYTPPSLATTGATWRKGKGHPRPLQPLEPPGDPRVFVTRSLPKTLGAVASHRGGRWTLRGSWGPARGRVLGLHLLPRGDTLAEPPAPKITVLPGTRLPTPAPCAGHGMCSSRRCPRGGCTSAPASAPLHFFLPGSFVSQE